MDTHIDIRGLKVLVMGLGLHGGGVETARYLARGGARVTCTDLRSRDVLGPSVAALEGLDIRFVLGEHRQEDFDSADLIVKNPAVSADSPWIAGRRNIETDISLFLRAVPNAILAVTGSKGKSTVVSALYHILSVSHPGVRLGGNITVSPLTFIDELNPADPVILELSSWQLADLRFRGLLRPKVCCITNLMHDHQNRYTSFEEYEADKMVIFENTGPDDLAVFPDDDRGRAWSRRCAGTSYLVREHAPDDSSFRGSWIDSVGRGRFHDGGGASVIVPEHLRVPGTPFRLNTLFAATMAALFGVETGIIEEAAGSFPGAAYRMEMFLEAGGVRFYDDTAATIPDAAAAAVRSLDRPVILIAGGTDKALDFGPFTPCARIPKLIVLLEGTATDRWKPVLENAGAVLSGPYPDMESAVDAALDAAAAGDAVVLSPGAASFGMFRHEFHRGDVFKELCRRKTQGGNPRPERVP